MVPGRFHRNGVAQITRYCFIRVHRGALTLSEVSSDSFMWVCADDTIMNIDFARERKDLVAT